MRSFDGSYFNPSPVRRGKYTREEMDCKSWRAQGTAAPRLRSGKSRGDESLHADALTRQLL